MMLRILVESRGAKRGVEVGSERESEEAGEEAEPAKARAHASKGSRAPRVRRQAR